MKKYTWLTILLISAMFSLAASCRKKPVPDDVPDPRLTEKSLLSRYSNGEISRCTYKGDTVYECKKNAPDAGSEIFDMSGNQMGACYYSTGMLDEVCKELENCRVIYRVDKNIWGLPAVNEIEP